MPPPDRTGEFVKALPPGPWRWIGWLLPHEETTPRGMFRWRVIVVTILIPTSVATLLAFGQIPAMFSGFASMTDVQQIAQQIDRLGQRSLEAQILDLRIRQCGAATPEARQLYAARIQPLLIEYLTLTGKVYPLPACSDL